MVKCHFAWPERCLDLDYYYEIMTVLFLLFI